MSVAGFVQTDSGEIWLDGRDVSALPPHRRNIGMVFQSYALFPHLSVLKNVTFPLGMRGIKGEEARRKAESILAVVGLAGFEDRSPRQLSGGQQQRVALARALVNRPAALLLDEPLGALDVKLRKQMQFELKRIQHELGTTFVYVTHDQEEALAMSNRIAVMNGGKVEQIGSPREIYERPRTAFVADFIGSLNSFELTIGELVGTFAVMRVSENERVVVAADGDQRVGEIVRVAVRPEQVRIVPIGSAVPDSGSRLEGTIAEIVYLGMYTQFHVDTRAGRIVSHRLADESIAQLEAGSRVTVYWEPEQASVLAS
jgi:spermidine/putrescine transport system ATP-binding protein